MKDIYIVFVDGEVASYLPGKYPQYSHAPREKFIDFVKGLRETYPEYRLRCVRNEGIEEWIRERMRWERIAFANQGRGK